jgi:hypothetical protein
MRWTVFILGILGVLSSGFLSYRWATDVLANRDKIEEIRPLVKSGIAGEKAKTDLEEFDRRSRAYLFVIGSTCLGAIGAGLALKRLRLAAGVLFLVAFFLPVATNPAALIFTSPFVLAGPLAFLIRSRSFEPKAAAFAGAKLRSGAPA